MLGVSFEFGGSLNQGKNAGYLERVYRGCRGFCRVEGFPDLGVPCSGSP